MSGFDAEIPDIAAYDVEMRRSLLDKAFYADKIDADVVVDYGCADGAAVAFMRAVFPERTYVGYDVSRAQLDAFATRNPGIAAYREWEPLEAHLRDVSASRPGTRIAVVANSVIHEVYAYGGEADVAAFWRRLFDPVFDTVVIRDMCVNRATTRSSDPLSAFKVRQRFDGSRLAEHERHWGAIDGNWSLVHFLLKYRYEANWAREVRENYLPLALEDLIAKVPAGWEPAFFEHFTLPFTRRAVKRDFGIELQDRTHAKLILERTVP